MRKKKSETMKLPCSECGVDLLASTPIIGNHPAA
jgi:hypothetical protein